MRNFRELEIWKEGISFTTQTYQLTKTYPKQEVYGLCSQLQRVNDWSRFIGIKASKPCFERREPNHQFRMGRQEDKSQ